MSDRVTFLRNYEASRTITWQHLQSLQQLTAPYSWQSEKIGQLRPLVKERFQLLEKAIAIERGVVADKKGLIRRAARAKKLRENIEAISGELKSKLKNSLQRRKYESHALLKNHQRANQLTIVLGGVLAGLLGLVMAKEIREREKTERQLRGLNNQKSQFFSIISHDLRGPTRNTTLLLEMMDDPAYASVPEDSKKMASLALESSRQTQKLVEDLLNWGRLQMDQVEVVTTQFRPYELTEKVCQALHAASVLKEITLENRIPRNLLVQADINMVESVIRNLVSNAIKFTPPAGKVQIVARQFGSFVELTIADSGVGMSPEALEKIFSFHTKHTTKGTAGESGTGLGLAFCREFVERNGGTIAVESQIGQGSKFNVRLPAAETMGID
jgi:signal transduction histidine kinase